MKKTKHKKKSVKRKKVKKKTIKRGNSKKEFFFDNYYKALIDSLTCFKQNFRLLVFPILSDIVLIFITGIIFGMFQGKLMSEMMEVMNTFAVNSQAIIDYATTDVLAETTTSFDALFSSMMGTFYLIWGLLFLIWVITQSISWYYSHKIAGTKEIGFLKMFTKFAGISLIGGVLLSLITVFGIKLIFTFMFRMSPILNFDTIRIVVFIVSLIIFYLLFVFYAGINLKIKKIWEIAVKKAHFLLLGVISAGIIVYIVSLLLLLIPNIVVNLILSVIIILPLLVFARIYLIKLVKRLS